MSSSRPLQWGAEALWEQLGPVLPGVSVEVLAQADSTNTRLLERARLTSGRRSVPQTIPGALDGGAQDRESATPRGRRNDDTRPCLLVAEQQTSGRGRQGRVWQSTTGASLTFSLALPLQPPSWSGLSLAVGVALADALDPAVDGAPLRIGLKWPNDLFLLDAPGRGRKLGGVLIETLPVGERRMAVVGIGLNVLPQAPNPELSSGFACLQEIWPEVDAPQALQRVAVPLAQALVRFDREGLAPFAAGFARRDMLFGQRVSTTAAEVSEGMAEGIDAQGALLVRAAALHALHSGEVSVRPVA